MMFASRPTLEIPVSWRSDPRGAERAIALLSASLGGTLDWDDRERVLDQLTEEVASRTVIPPSVPVIRWYERIFDAALEVLADYCDLQLVFEERAPADRQATAIVLDAWRNEHRGRAC